MRETEQLCANFERCFQNRLEALQGVAREAVAFMDAHGINAEAAYNAHLAIHELISNVIKYGYKDSEDHGICLQLRVNPGALVVVLEDDGMAFNPLAVPEPDLNVPAEAREPGGLGILLVRRLIQQIDYARVEGKNRLTLSIPLLEKKSQKTV